MWLIIVLFFFKQKTAYEMRISDWSSDVCSSDLPSTEIVPVAAHRQRGNADRAAKIEREYLRSLIATKLERHEGQKHRLAGAGWTHNQGVTDVADMNGKPERGGAFGPAEEQWGRTEMLVQFRSRPHRRTRKHA